MLFGQNEDCIPGESTSGALRNCPKEAGGRPVYISDFCEGGVHAIKHTFFQKVSAGLIKLLLVMKNSQHHEGF